MTGIIPSAADARWRSITLLIHPLGERAYMTVRVAGHKGAGKEWSRHVMGAPVEVGGMSEDPSTREVLAVCCDVLWELLQRTDE